MADNRPKVWVWVIVLKEWKILLWKRKNSHWNWDWAFAWWHLEFWENFEDCAKREVFEETWIKIKNLRFAHVTNDIFINENKHYVTIFMIWEYLAGELKIMEPLKCEKWDFFEPNNLPSPLFLPIQNLLANWFNIWNL